MRTAPAQALLRLHAQLVRAELDEAIPRRLALEHRLLDLLHPQHGAAHPLPLFALDLQVILVDRVWQALEEQALGLEARGEVRILVAVAGVEADEVALLVAEHPVAVVLGLDGKLVAEIL